LSTARHPTKRGVTRETFPVSYRSTTVTLSSFTAPPRTRRIRSHAPTFSDVNCAATSSWVRTDVPLTAPITSPGTNPPRSPARPGQGDHQLADLRRGIAPGRHAETRGLRPHYGQIGSWITTGQSGSDELTIGETDPDIVLLLNDVVSCYDRPVGGPDDSTSGEPPPGFDSNHRWPSLLDYSRDPAADFLQSLHHIHHLHST